MVTSQQNIQDTGRPSTRLRPDSSVATEHAPRPRLQPPQRSRPGPLPGSPGVADQAQPRPQCLCSRAPLRSAGFPGHSRDLVAAHPRLPCVSGRGGVPGWLSGPRREGSGRRRDSKQAARPPGGPSEPRLPCLQSSPQPVQTRRSPTPLSHSPVLASPGSSGTSAASRFLPPPGSPPSLRPLCVPNASLQCLHPPTGPGAQVCGPRGPWPPGPSVKSLGKSTDQKRCPCPTPQPRGTHVAVPRDGTPPGGADPQRAGTTLVSLAVCPPAVQGLTHSRGSGGVLRTRRDAASCPSAAWGPGGQSHSGAAAAQRAVR